MVAVLFGLVGSIATSNLPRAAEPYLFLAWPLTGLFGILSIFLAYLSVASEEGTGTERSARLHYVTVLNQVDAVIAQRLRTSLRELVRIELDLVHLADDPALRPQVLLRREGRGGTPLPGGVIEAWRESQHSLLLLGAPGAGKSTMLLELASALSSTAHASLAAPTHRDESPSAEAKPIPIVVDLTDWRPPRLRQGRRHLVGRHRGETVVPAERDPLKWLVTWLRVHYRIRQGVARQWLENDSLALLFDGLDEVPDHHRAACVSWLNALCDRRETVPITIVSRTNEFVRLQRPLRHIVTVAEIQPLTREKVESYLAGAGATAEPISAALRGDPRLWELLNAPIWLLIITLTRRGAAVRGAASSVEAGRQQLLDNFVAAVVHRRRPADRFSPDQTVRWLAQLARLSRWDLRLSRLFLRSRNADDAWASTGVAAVNTVAAAALSLPLTRSYGLVTTLCLGVVPLSFLLYRSARVEDSPIVFSGIGVALGLLIVRAEQAAIPWFRNGFRSISVGWMMKYEQGGDPTTGVGGQVVDLHKWITDDQFRDFMTVFAPGVIAVMVTYACFFWGNRDGDTGSGRNFLVCPLISVAPFVIALTDHVPVVGPFRGYWEAGLAMAIPTLIAGAILALPLLALRFPLKPATAYLGYAVTGFITFGRHVARGRTPLRLRRFLRQATDHHLLIRDHEGYRFPHALFRDYFARLDPATATAPPEIRGDNAA
ncbi:NACHT domain-containing NTPase [Streptomyces sp. TLI_146]|uniref:NACHT domain-containing protein n=1 Tax=Streptomyces sp. TLI_146 TaxID=1938858 RepID=UPI0015D648F8|nr:NACHT domain-containing protein [Streptomyces sp. TLI_146]